MTLDRCFDYFYVTLLAIIVVAVIAFGGLSFAVALRNYQRGSLPPCAPVEQPPMTEPTRSEIAATLTVVT